MRLLLAFLIPLCLYSGTPDISKVPEYARSNFKINQVVVFLGEKEGVPNPYLAKVFGTVRDGEGEIEYYALKFYDDPFKDKIFSGFKPLRMRKLFSYLEGVDLRSHDPVVATLNDGSLQPAIVRGIYIGQDGSPSFVLRFVGGDHDAKTGFDWKRASLNKLKKMNDGPLRSESYVQFKDSLVRILIGEIDSTRYLLRETDKESFEIAHKDDIRLIHTYDNLPLTLPTETKPTEKPAGPLPIIETE